MNIVPYNPKLPYDPIFKQMIGVIDTKLNQDEDDFLMLCVGPTGTGKSMLMLHAMDEYMKHESSIDVIGLDRTQFAEALKIAKDKPLPRFCGNDEANISKRDALSKFNKDMLDLYYSIRGLRIFHWWNNPSLEMIDKPFIKERVKGVIFIFTKNTKGPRLYYYYTKAKILDIFEKHGHLDLRLLRKLASSHAMYRGWFYNYDGPILPAYKEKKDKRMGYKVDNFFEKYGEAPTKLTSGRVANILGISNQTVLRYEEKMKEESLILPTDIERNAVGWRIYSMEFVQKMREYLIKHNVIKNTKVA